MKAATRRGREVGRGRGKSKVMKRKLSREKNVFRRGRLRRSEAEEEGGKRAVQDQSDFTGISRTQKYGVFLQRDCPFASTVVDREVLNVKCGLRPVELCTIRADYPLACTKEEQRFPFTQYLYTFLLVKILLTTKCPPTPADILYAAEKASLIKSCSY